MALSLLQHLLPFHEINFIFLSRYFIVLQLMTLHDPLSLASRRKHRRHTLLEDERRLCKLLTGRYIRSVLKDVLSCGPERLYLTCK